MKWIIVIFSFLIKQLSGKTNPTIHPIEELKEFIKENALRFAAGLIIITAIGTMFTVGISITLMNLAAQYDMGLYPKLTATSLGGLSLSLVSIFITGIIIYNSTPTKEREFKRKMKKRKQQEGASWEDALVLLVNDFIKERELTREIRREERYHTQFTDKHRQAEEKMQSSSFRSSEEFERH